jgi:hypothetical protein
MAEKSYISQVQLPGVGTPYWIKDKEGRAIFATDFNSQQAYATGDHVIYEGNLYRFHTNHTAGTEWNEAQVDPVTVDSEIKRLEQLIGDSGLRYVGQTYTNLYDGASTSPVVIQPGGASHSPITGDIVFYPLTTTNTSTKVYATATEYYKNDVIYKNDGSEQSPFYRYYRANADISASDNPN